MEVGLEDLLKEDGEYKRKLVDLVFNGGSDTYFSLTLRYANKIFKRIIEEKDDKIDQLTEDYEYCKDSLERTLSDVSATSNMFKSYDRTKYIWKKLPKEEADRYFYNSRGEINYMDESGKVRKLTDTEVERCMLGNPGDVRIGIAYSSNYDGR